MQSEIVAQCPWHEPRFLSRAEDVVEAGRAAFQNTAFSNGKPIGGQDLETIDRFFAAVAPDQNRHPHLANWEGPGSLMEHCHLSGRIAFRLTEQINEKLNTTYNPYAQQAALELHDLGRTVIHSFMETDELTDILWSHIGLRTDLKNLTHNAHIYWDGQDLDFESLPIPTRISIIADVFGKRSAQDTNRIRHTNEILEAVKNGKTKYLQKPDRTRYEEELVHRLPAYSSKEEYVISHTLGWLNRLGIDLDELLDGVMQEYGQETEAVCIP